MTYQEVLDPETIDLLVARGGVVTIDKDDPHQRTLWLRLTRLADASVVEEIDNTITTVSYRLTMVKAAA